MQGKFMSIYRRNTIKIRPRVSRRYMCTTAASISNAAIQTTATVNFILPSVSGISLTAAASALSTTAGTPVPATLSITGTGNAATSVTLTFVADPNLNVAGVLSPVTVNRGLTALYSPTGSYWRLHQGALNPAGQLITSVNGEAQFDGVPVTSLPKTCGGLATDPQHMTSSCRAALSGYRSFITYQPASRFWTFQGIETGIFVALVAILLTVTAIVLIRRDA